MSQQPDLRGHGSQEPEASAWQPGVEQAGVEQASAERVGVEGAGVEGAGGEPASVERVGDDGVGGERAAGVSGSAGGGWSGRAVGPLSGLLPGGAVDLTAEEMPVERPASVVQAGDHDSASATAGANGDEVATGLSASDQKQAASAAANGHEPPSAAVVDDHRSAAGGSGGSSPQVNTAAAKAAASSSAADGAPAGDHEPEAVLAADDAQPAEATQATAPTEPGRTGTDDRWHSVLVGFVDDPRGSVEAARALIDEDIAAHITLLARRREAMHAAWQANQDADTEALRLALVHYRDLRKKLADVVATLAG